MRYDAELTIEQFGRGYNSDEKIVVTFGWDQTLFDVSESGIIDDLIIGRWEDGKPLTHPKPNSDE